MKLKSILSILLCILITFHYQSSSQSVNPTNKEIVHNFLKEFSDTLSVRLDTSNHKNIYLKIIPNLLSDFIESIVINKLSNKGFKFFLSNCDSCNTLQISVNHFKIEYKRVWSERPTNRIVRSVELDIITLLKNSDASVGSINFKKSFSDTLTFNDIDIVERDGTPFTAPRPKEPENFLKKYFEPIVVIGSTALAILLFFTIRSK